MKQLPAQPFFLDAAPGKRFCLYHPSAPQIPCRGAFVYVHPFAEEMNKSRRMAALQSRALAARGYAVLQIDLYGCGDSSGDFAEARWDIWKQDVAAAHAWLCRESGVTAGLWGLRLGALLALDVAATTAGIARLLLWQPVLRGETFLTQFLRLRLAADMLAGQAPQEQGTSALRERLRAGAAVEVAGYMLAPALAEAIDAADAASLAPPQRADWIELSQQSGHEPPPAATRLQQAWRSQGTALQARVVSAPAFWLSQEIMESPALLAATCDAAGAGQA